MTVWRQERPTWCPIPACLFKRRVEDAICGGELPNPLPHDSDMNTHRLCLPQADIMDLQVNRSDLNWFRWVYDALDGKSTSFTGTTAAESKGGQV